MKDSWIECFSDCAEHAQLDLKLKTIIFLDFNSKPHMMEEQALRAIVKPLPCPLVLVKVTVCLGKLDTIVTPDLSSFQEFQGTHSCHS